MRTACRKLVFAGPKLTSLSRFGIRVAPESDRPLIPFEHLMTITTFQPFADAPLARRMLELSPAAVAVLDNEGIVVFINDKLTQLLGYTSEDLIGRSSEAFLPATLLCGEVPHPARPLSHPWNDHAGAEKKITARSEAGLNVPVIVNLHEIVGSRESLWLIHIFSADPQPLDRDRLKSERLAAVAQMVSGLAHESRNALQRAVASLDLLELDLKNNPDQMMLSQRIRKSLDDLLANYNEVRRYAEPIIVKLQSVKLFRLCQTAFTEILLEKVACPHQLEPKSDIDDTAHVDSEKMKVVFRHVLENSVDAAGDVPAHIEFRCQRFIWRNQDAVTLEFRDHGCGFDNDSLRHAFQPFYTTKQHGTGLGLAVCRRIVEAHRGEIHATNHSEGGAVIEITVPTKCVL